MRNLSGFVLIACAALFSPLAGAGELLSTSEAQTLARDLQPLVREIKSERYVYHYTELNGGEKTSTEGPLFQGRPLIRGDASTLARLHSGSPEVQAYLHAILERPWKGGHPGFDGVYAATDPAASRNWGGKENRWILIRVKLPGGSRFLSKDKELSWSDSSLQILKSRGCETFGGARSVQEHFEDFKSRPGCVRLLQELFGRTKISGMNYGWYASEFEGCDPDRASSSGIETLILMGSQGVREENVAVFTATNFRPDSTEAAKRDLDERLATQELLKDPKASTYDDGAPPLLWPELKDQSYPKIAEWKARHLLGCESAAGRAPQSCEASGFRESVSPSTGAPALLKGLRPALFPLTSPTNPK